MVGGERVRGIRDGGFTGFISENSCAFEVRREYFFHYSYFEFYDIFILKMKILK